MNSTGASLEGEFYQYMHSLHEVDAAANELVLQFYVPYFAQCKQVLDVGCGEGQFIAELAAQRVRASGIDADPIMVQECRKKGLSVVEADLFDYLPQHSGEFDGIFCSNLIEHLAMSDVLRFLQLARAALQPGGLLLIATPNAESLIVQLYEFWRDATHIRLYNRPLLAFLLSWAGLQSVQSGENPATIWTPPAELQSIPSVLQHLTPVQELSPEKGNAQATSDARMLPAWRRAISPLRRRFEHLLQRTILFEMSNRVAVLEVNQATLTTAAQQVGSALYNSSSHSLVAPREIFALGVNPALEHKD